MDIMRYISEQEKDLLAGIEDELRAEKEFLAMNTRLIEIAHEEEESLLVHTERLGEHEALLDMESGALLLDNGKHQVVLAAQEAYMLLDFLYQHRDTLDEAMHRIVE